MKNSPNFETKEKSTLKFENLLDTDAHDLFEYTKSDIENRRRESFNLEIDLDKSIDSNEFDNIEQAEESIENRECFTIVRENIHKIGVGQRIDISKRMSYYQKTHIMSCGVSSGGNYAATVNYSGDLYMYNLNHTDPVPEFKENVHVNTVASSLKWLKRLNNPFNSLIIVTTDGSVECFSQKNKGLLWSLIDQESVYLSLDINYNSTIFACGQKSGLIDLYDMKKKKKIVQFSRGSDFVMGHVNRVASLKFLDDDINLLLSGGCDNMIYLWDIRAQDPVRSLSGVQVAADTLDCKKGKFICASMEDKHPLHMYDFRSFKKIEGLDWYQKGRDKRESVKIFGTSFFPGKSDFTLMACGSNRNELRIFSPIDEEFNYLHTYTIKNKRKGIFNCCLAETKDRLLFGTGDGFLHSLSLSY